MVNFLLIFDLAKNKEHKLFKHNLLKHEWEDEDFNFQIVIR